MSYTVAALYRFTDLPDPASLRAPIQDACQAAGVTGTLLLAREGINGTIAGTAQGIEAALAHIRTLPGCSDIAPRLSQAPTMPFPRLKVRLKAEIVTLGVPQADPTRAVGTYVPPDAWNELILAPDVAVIDTRNDYEVSLGTFQGALDPATARFRDFPAWWAANRDRLSGKRIAMFCTGGIRCEKATSLLRAEGVEEVYHLKGGILGYLETVAPEESLWEGRCFVFDGRVSVGHGLEPGPDLLCHACRRPLTPEETRHPEYEAGVACHRCAAEHDATARERFRERQRQIALAAARGDRHLGGPGASA